MHNYYLYPIIWGHLKHVLEYINFTCLSIALSIYRNHNDSVVLTKRHNHKELHNIAQETKK